MKTIFYILFFISAFGFSQGKYITKTGELKFEASVPSFEEVAAKNNAVTAILNTENGEIAALVLINVFRFKNALMEEHFNENYAETNTYPKAIFEGNIRQFSKDNISGDFQISGKLTFHGVTKTIESIPVTINSGNESISIIGEFKVLASDFNIEIPKIVKNKIAEEVKVSFRFELIKK